MEHLARADLLNYPKHRIVATLAVRRRAPRAAPSIMRERDELSKGWGSDGGRAGGLRVAWAGSRRGLADQAGYGDRAIRRRRQYRHDGAARGAAAQREIRPELRGGKSPQRRRSARHRSGRDRG